MPPAPSTLKTSTPSSSFASRDAAWNARAVVSQPPPAAAGAMIEICRVGYGCDASSPPDAPPGATIATTAAIASNAPMTAREFSRFPTLQGHYPVSCRAVHRIAAALVVLAFAGCGGENPEPTPEPTPALDANRCTPAEAPAPKTAELKAPTDELDGAKTYVAAIKTNCGDFEITLDAERAPKTAASFKSLADQKFYDGTTFHRIVPGFVIQGGDPNGDGSGGPGYSVEEAPPKDLTYDVGVVAMAKAGDEPAGTSGSSSSS